MRDVALPRADQLESLAGQVPGRGGSSRWPPQPDGPRTTPPAGPWAPCVREPVTALSVDQGDRFTTHADLSRFRPPARIVAVFDSFEHEPTWQGCWPRPTACLSRGVSWS